MVVPQRELFKHVSSLKRQSNWPEAFRALGDALRCGRLDAEGVEKAGRLCTELITLDGGRVAARVLVLGQCTTTWLANSLAGVASARGARLPVTDGPYDNVIQELLALEPANAPDFVVLVPWSARLLAGGSNRSVDDRLDDECQFWTQAWNLVRDRAPKVRIVQVGYDWVTPGPMGHALGAAAGGDVNLVRRVNEKLRGTLPSGAFFIDLEQVSGVMGRQNFYDARRYFWTKQPWSETGAVYLAEHIWAGIRALLTGPKKVLVLDLDNTLWGGVVGEAGPLGIELGEGPDGEAFRAFQKHVKRLTERGVLLAVCSKNNDADAREPFEKNPHMVLSLDDFAHFEASWDAKSIALRRMADALQVGMDSFVFFDDNPAEREEVRQALREVEIVDVPADPSEFIVRARRWPLVRGDEPHAGRSGARRSISRRTPAARRRRPVRFDSTRISRRST